MQHRVAEFSMSSVGGSTGSAATKPKQKGPWVPRALKKRSTEFNVETEHKIKVEPAISSSSTAKPAKADADSTAGTWNGAADLDDLADDQPDTKRPRLGSEDAAPFKSEAPDEKRDEILEAAPRLAAHIKSASKFNKVAAMAYSLLEAGRVTEANAAAFFTVLEAGMHDPYRLRQKEYRVAYRRLYDAACKRSSMFPASVQATLELWQVRIMLQLDFFTDDTFQFTAGVRKLRGWLEKLPCIYPALEPADVKHMPEEARAPWVDVLFDCAEVAVMHYKYLWAKTAIDMLVKSVIDRRQNFSEEQQRAIQTWNAMSKGQKIQRQQEAARSSKEQTAYEKKEEEWRLSDVKSGKSNWAKDSMSGVNLGGLDAWAAKQFNN